MTETFTHINGIAEPIPDITPLLEPTKWGDIATYTFFGIAGLFLGGETGILTGMRSARSTITRDLEVKVRIDKAYRNFRADILKRELKALESDKPNTSINIWSYKL